MSQPTSTYVSSSGTLGSQPLISRMTSRASDYATLAYLFFHTLVSPIVDPASWANPSTPGPSRAGGRSGSNGGSNGLPSGNGGNGGGGRGGGGNGGRGGGWRGNSSGGFMNMSDLSGGQTVDGCRATCG